MPCPNKWVPSRLCRLGKVGGVVCKMPIFRQACTSIVENVQVFIQTTIPVQGRTQQTHFNTVGNFYMMALCNQIGSFVRLSSCHFVCTKYSKRNVSPWALGMLLLVLFNYAGFLSCTTKQRGKEKRWQIAHNLFFAVFKRFAVQILDCFCTHLNGEHSCCMARSRAP